jgi:hypothetical protein
MTRSFYQKTTHRGVNKDSPLSVFSIVFRGKKNLRKELKSAKIKAK